MSVHKWKVFKGRFLGLENYEKILGDIPAFGFFILGLLLLILSYWIWSELKDKFKNKIFRPILTLLILILGLYLININWDKMLLSGDEDYLYSLIYTFIILFLQLFLRLVLV